MNMQIWAWQRRNSRTSCLSDTGRSNAMHYRRLAVGCSIEWKRCLTRWFSIALSALFLSVHLTGYCAEGLDKSACVLKGKKLFGKVRVVNSFADLKVQTVSSFPDLNVQRVDSFPDACGKWQFVDSFPDITIEMVTSFPDLTIQYVESFPGLQ